MSTFLRLEAARTVLQRGGQAHAMNFGVDSIAGLFRQEPSAPREIEQAIDIVEEELMRVPPALRGRRELASDDARLRAWAAGDATLAVDAVEALFQRVASASLGQPAALHGLPNGREAAGALLILREVMHHLGYVAVAITARPAALA